MTSDPLPAHSLAEAYLYLMATPCPQCGRGPLRGEDARPEPGDGQARLTIPVQCGACGSQDEYVFTVPTDRLSLEALGATGPAGRLNPTDQPSRILDVAQWIMLFRMITEAASKDHNKIEARRLGYEAAQCLEEALKFYDVDNDLPPDDALFHESSRRRHREHPGEFSRERLIELRAKLPTLDAMEASQFVSRETKRKRWWAWWR